MLSLPDLIDKMIEQKLPFASYCLPGETIPTSMLGGSYSNASEDTDDEFVVAPFDMGTSNQIMMLHPTFKTSGWSIKPEISAVLSENTKHSAVKPEIPFVVEFSTYKRQFDALMQGLASNELKKVVLSRVIRLQLYSGSKPSQIFKKLSEKYPNAFVYILCDPAGCIWLGATPETLVRTEESLGFTMSLAGTQTLHNADIESVVWGRKEMEEQQFVTDYIAEKLNETGVENLNYGEAETVAAGNIAHLCTQFTFRLPENYDAIDMARKLHPTPAICGLPPELALETIKHTELHKRSLYCGFLGAVSRNKHAHLFVNLRCMQIIGNEAFLYVGGGLTSDSELIKEWDETQVKAETLSSIIRE
jgi:isochorismate synthase